MRLNRAAQIGALLLAIGALASAQAETWNKRWEAGSHPELRVHAGDAAIEVQGRDGTGIDATLTTRGWSIGGNGVRVVEHQQGDIIDIDVRIPSTHMSFGERSVKLVLQVPRQLRADVHTGDGSIRLSNVGGTIRAETGDGSVQGDQLEGALTARTGDGSVHIGGRFNELQLHTQDGSVELTVESGSKLNVGWRVETGDGSVRVSVPGDLAADLEVRTGDGSIRIDSALRGGSEERREHEVRARLNGGGATFVIRTGDGSVNVNRN